MHILTVGTALPPNHYDQQALIEALESAWSKTHFNTARVRRFHEAVLVGGRHLALTIDDYNALSGFGDANDAFLRVATDIGAQALTSGLEQAGLAPTDIDAMFTATVTGVATPALGARLFHRLGLRPDVKRTPIFGLGCVAGAAGISRVHDYLKAYPDQVAVLLCVELCSLTLQRTDMSVANLIASGLFGDGAAAVICVGEERAKRLGLAGPKVRATKSRLYPDSERVMGWDVGDGGFKVVLDKSVPAVVERYLRADVDGFLGEQGLTRDDIGAWICHPGGPKVVKAYASTLELDDSAFQLTWDSLAREGNMSSASVLFILRDTMQRGVPAGAPALLMAMGPGFCSEVVLLEWPA